MSASYETHRKQLELILEAWGMPKATAAGTAEIMSWADLHGIDTHGISMVPPYDERRRASKLDIRAEPKVVKETPVVLARLITADNEQAKTLLRSDNSVLYGHCRRCNMPLQPWDAAFIVGRKTPELDKAMKAKKAGFKGEWTETEAKLAMVDVLLESFGDLVIALRPERFNSGTKSGHPDGVRAYHLVVGNLGLCKSVHPAGGEGKQRYSASPRVQVKRTLDVVEDYKPVSCAAFAKATGWVVVDLADMIYIATANDTARRALGDGSDHLRVERREDTVAHRLLTAQAKHDEAVGKPKVVEMVRGRRGDQSVLEAVADMARGAQLVGRVSGDSTCAYAWAYAAAVEAACGVEAPPRALLLRALMLERERVANHLGDLGALGNDAAFAFGLTQFLRLKEDWLRLNQRVFGHRFMMDRIVPGGVGVDADARALAGIVAQCATLGVEVGKLRELYDEHPGLQDRFATTGSVDMALARELSLTGIAARASGILLDGRVHRQGYTPPPPYAALGVRPVTDERGDVAARVAVRFEEIFESLRLLGEIAVGMVSGDIRADIAPMGGGSGLGVVEGWRGEVLVGVEFAGDGSLARVHPHDPSWQAWPALEHAVMKDIVPDFPLINKSFNLSYAGADL